jgi:hypothetical protein
MSSDVHRATDRGGDLRKVNALTVDRDGWGFAAELQNTFLLTRRCRRDPAKAWHGSTLATRGTGDDKKLTSGLFITVDGDFAPMNGTPPVRASRNDGVR